MRVKFIRYHPCNNSLHIGGKNNKLSVFISERAARLHIGRKTFHFGRW